MASNRQQQKRHSELYPSDIGELPIHRCLHNICCCPLRLNQMNSTTTRTAPTTLGRNMRHSYSTNDNCRHSQDSNTMTNDSDTVVELIYNNMQTPERPNPKRCSRNRYCGNPEQLSSKYLLVGLVACLLIELSTSARFALAAVADQQPIFSTAVGGHYSTSVGHVTGPSLCPLVPNCHCKWINGKQTAICTRRNLISIPDNLLPETQMLDLSGNPLTKLDSLVFQEKHLTNLQKLHLSECRITYIADDAFAHLTNLVELDLSHNFLQHVPSKSFWSFKYSIRRLSLAYNPIQSIEPEAFSMVEKLTVLDMNNCQLNQLKPNAFFKVDQLKELKLADNNLTQLPLSVVSNLKEYSMLDLFGNPWHCDCELRQSMDWMKRFHMQMPIEPTCATPYKFKDQRWSSLKVEEFFCPPSVINKHNELTVGAGSNISLACSARGTPPLTFIWFQDEKNLTTGRANSSEPPSSTKLLEEKRYEIAEEISPGSYGQPNVTTSILYLYDLKITDTSLFLCWVDNAAGSSFANFSLTVNDSPPIPSPGFAASSWFWRTFGQTEAQVGIVIIGFVILLVAAILLLILVKHNSSNSSKSSHSSDLKKSNGGNNHLHNLQGVISSANKFSQQGRNSMMTDTEDSDDPTGADSDGEQQSTSSSSSCHKNPSKMIGTGELNGFIEHMRSGIINMDYHSMSPVIQFNNTLKGNPNCGVLAKQQQQLQQPYLDTAMHHFPSASNTSSIPGYYGGNSGGNRSASMATTTSDLSPSSGSMNANFANQSAPTTNCDLQRNQNVNATTASYTSDYQSGYSAAEDPTSNLTLHPHHLHHQQQQQQMMYDPMQQFNPTNNSHMYQRAPLVDAAIRPHSMIYNPSTLDHHQLAEQQHHDDLVLQNMIQNGGQLPPANQRHHLVDHQLHIL